MTAEEPLSQNEIGRRLGLSSATMSKLRAQGCPMDSLEAVRAWREQNLNIAQRKPDPTQHTPRDDKQESHDAARTRLRIAEANLAELREAKTRREVINLAVVERQLASTFATLRDALLQLPDRLAPGLVAETDAHVIHGILDSEIRQTLHDLANAGERMKNDEGAFQ